MERLNPIYTEKRECQDCHKCIRECPVKAIRVQDGYAAFRIGLSYFKEIPSDFFIMPPSYQCSLTAGSFLLRLEASRSGAPAVKREVPFRVE